MAIFGDLATIVLYIVTQQISFWIRRCGCVCEMQIRSPSANQRWGLEFKNVSLLVHVIKIITSESLYWKQGLQELWNEM